MIKLYSYKNCDTCRKAKKHLNEIGIAFTEHPIRDTPPSVKELAFVYKGMNNNMTRLFNTSGVDYRKLNIKDTLPHLTVDEQLNLLHSNGNLIKRPVLITEKVGISGYNREYWESAFTDSK